MNIEIVWATRNVQKSLRLIIHLFQNLFHLLEVLLFKKMKVRKKKSTGLVSKLTE